MSNDEIQVRDARRWSALSPKPEPKPKPKPKPELVTWRWCVRIRPDQINDPAFYSRWYETGHIPEHWYPLEAQSQPIETIQQLPEGQEP
jgi:hypothetical protein